MTTVYDYVAVNNPSGAKRVCEAFGYRVTNPKNMSQNLKTLVNNEGEEAIKMIMDMHPDKDIILDMFSTKQKPVNNSQADCGCTKHNSTAKMLEQYLNANGRQENTEARALATNTNTIIFASALVLAVAIIFKNDK